MGTAIAQNISVKKTVKTQRLISLETFRRLYDDRKDDFKYEWNNGLVEKTPRSINRNLYWLVSRLTRLFIQTAAYRQNGEIFTTIEMFMPISNRTRKPDLAFLTDKQIVDTANNGEFVSAFVIEIISKSDNINRVGKKLDEYFTDGVQVVWHIFPLLEKVEVYTSPTDVTICRGATVCSAAPVLPDFDISAADLFKMP